MLRNLALALLAVVILTSLAAAQRTLTVKAANTEFEVTLPDQQLAATDAELTTYVTRGATAIAAYFGRFPMKHVKINIRAVGGDRVRFGRTTPQAGGTIMMMIGREATADALASDWTLTHEMSHLSFPGVKGDHDWLEEGMATYVEPIARAQAGYLTPAYVWNQFVDSMPKGEPATGDRGLDNTQTWGRTYWGGALFCLIADVEIRKQTHNKRGLQDAFRAIMQDNGTMEYEWGIDMIFAEGDKATGTHVLETLYAEWKAKPVEVDLDKLWQELGVVKTGDSVTFNEKARLAAIRKAITDSR
jgi:hypothetical protein